MRSLIVGMMLLTLTACFGRWQPIYNVYYRPMPVTVEKLSLEQVRDTIIQAGAKRGWVVIDEKQPGVLDVTLNARSHFAHIIVAYDKETFSIQYKESRNLLYEEGLINRNYNRWIRNLEADIVDGLQKRSES